MRHDISLFETYVLRSSGLAKRGRTRWGERQTERGREKQREGEGEGERERDGDRERDKENEGGRKQAQGEAKGFSLHVFMSEHYAAQHHCGPCIEGLVNLVASRTHRTVASKALHRLWEISISREPRQISRTTFHSMTTTTKIAVMRMIIVTAPTIGNNESKSDHNPNKATLPIMIEITIMIITKSMIVITTMAVMSTTLVRVVSL